MIPAAEQAPPIRPSSTEEATARRVRAWRIALIFAAALVVYLNSLANGFVWDDFLIILDNRWIRSFAHLGEIFSSSVSGFTDPALIPNYYRPLIYVYYTLAYRAFGSNPFGYHLLNIVVHGLNSLLVYACAGALLRNEGEGERHFLSAPLVAAMLFAVHPLHAEAIDFIGACTELLFALFLLLSFWLYVSSPGLRSPRYAGSVLCYLASTLFKEPGVALPILVVLYDVAFRRELFRSARGLARYLPYLAATAIYFGLRHRALGVIVPYKRHAELGLYEHVINAAPLFLEYLSKLFVPVRLSVFYPFEPVTSAFQPACLLGVALGAATAAAMAICVRRSPAVFASLAFLTVPLLPALYVSGVGENAFADRYAYVPSVGFVILLALAWARASTLHVRGAAIALACAVAVVALYGYGTVRRNAVWRDDWTLWSDAAAKAPRSQRPFKALGDERAKQKDYDGAIRLYQRALQNGPPEVGLLDSLGIAYVFSGDYPEAERCFRGASAILPDDPKQFYNLGLLYARWKRFDDAIAALETALRLKPDYEKAAASLRFVRQERSSAR